MLGTLGAQLGTIQLGALWADAVIVLPAPYPDEVAFVLYLTRERQLTTTLSRAWRADLEITRTVAIREER
jgi:hypothetical protein